MFRLLRFLFWMVALGVFAYFATTVPLGKHTLAGHIANIWRTPEAQEFRKGTKEAAAPLVEKAVQGVKNLVLDGGMKEQPQRGSAR